MAKMARMKMTTNDEPRIMTMRNHLLIAGAGLSLALILAATPVVAHHSFAAEFDANQPITLRGTVTRMEWINPHSWIHIDVKNDDGSVTKWMIEGGTPNTLLRRGFRKDELKAGTEIIVEGYRAKNGANRANGRDLLFTDGRRLFMGSSGTGAPQDAADTPER
jgi:hypothetical protein